MTVTVQQLIFKLQDFPVDAVVVATNTDDDDQQFEIVDLRHEKNTVDIMISEKEEEEEEE